MLPIHNPIPFNAAYGQFPLTNASFPPLPQLCQDNTLTTQIPQSSHLHTILKSGMAERINNSLSLRMPQVGTDYRQLNFCPKGYFFPETIQVKQESNLLNPSTFSFSLSCQLTDMALKR